MCQSVYRCDSALRRSVVVLCMLYKIRHNLLQLLNGALAEPYVQVQDTLDALVAHRYTYVAPRCSTAVLLLTFQFPSGTILLTLYSMVWDWWVSTAGPMLFNLHKLFYPYYCLLYYFFIFLLSVYRFVLWGWGICTDRV